jgi:hypothetical protein
MGEDVVGNLDGDQHAPSFIVVPVAFEVAAGVGGMMGL